MIKKYLKKKINGIKICAVITTVCFMVSTLGSNLYAIPMSENANKKYEDVFNKASSISSEYGKITALKDANSNVTVVNIQDLHCHAQTQRNISKIIGQLAKKYNLKRIYVEGGYGEIDTSWLNSVKDENIRKQVIEELLEQGILTGSEYYKLTSGNKEIELKGIDEEKLHKENIKRLSWLMENQDKYKNIIKNVNKEIELLEKEYVNSENKRFSVNIEKYVKNDIDTKRFYRQLIKYVKDINGNPQKYNNITAIDLNEYPNIMKFMKLTKISQKMNVKEITSQLYMVINEIKAKLPYNVYTKFVEETENFQDSQKLVELVTLLCNKAGIDLDNKYSSLKDFLESNEINRNLNSVELVREERDLIEEIRAALSYNNEEYEITYISDFSKSFQDYLEYKLMEGDWQYFKQGFAKFRNLYGKYAVTDRIKEIEQDFAQINNYYEINDKRNEVFVNNLLENENPQLLEDKTIRQEEEVLSKSKDVIIAVTGGFHSQALEEILQAKEVNTIVITPSIYEGIDKATKVYKGIIKDQSKQFQSQALAYTIASCETNKNKQNILLNAVKDIVGTNSDKIKEILGKDVDLSELNNIEQLTQEEQKEASVIKQILNIEADSIANLLPVEGGKTILLPDMDKLIIAVSEELVNMGIYLSDGAIFDIENSVLNGKDLKGIPAEIYSRMAPEIQEALLSCEVKAEGIESNDLASQSESAKKTKTKKQSKKYKKSQKVYSVVQTDTDKRLTEERKSELLSRFYDKNINAFNKLISVCEQYDFDLSKDSPLLDMFIRKINARIYYNLDEVDSIVKRSLKVTKTFLIDMDLKFSCLEKYIDTFDEESDDEEFEDEYIRLFRTLFSLKQEHIEYFNEKIDAENAEVLLLFFESTEIDDNLTSLFKRYKKELMKNNNANRMEYLFDNITKLDGVSEEDFSYLMSLPETMFAVVLNTSQNSSQLIEKINLCRDFSLGKYDITKVKAVLDNAEKIKNLSRIEFSYMMIFDKESVSFILNNVRNAEDIEKVLYFHRIMGISTSFDSRESVNDFKDPRFKAVVKYISLGDKEFFNELFSNKKIIKIIADSIDDGNFIKDYILNPNYKNIYTDLFTSLVNLNIKNIATENNHLALKLFIDDEFNNMLKISELANISDENNLVAKYHCAIAVSRFIFDSIGEEITDYDFSSRFFRDIIKQALDSYLTYSKAMKNVVLIDKNTQIFALCNNEAYDGTKSRFNTDALNGILSFIKKHNDVINFERSKDEQAAQKWLSAIRNFGINDMTEKQNAYFLFRGHGGKDELEIVSPSKPKVFRDRAISEKQKVKAESITVEELADALIYAATREKNPLDLRKITIDLSCCNSYYFARTLCSLLAEKGLTSFTFPTIITAAGLETEFGYTIENNTGNLHKGIMSAMSVMKVAKGSLSSLTLDMIATMEYQMTESNITMFTSFRNEKLLDKVERGKTKIKQIYSDMQKSKKASEQMRKIETVLKNKNLQQVSSLPKRMVEASILSPIKNSVAQAFSEKAHIWEEVLFRAVPALITVINPVIGIPLFLIMQPLFVFSHTIVKWVVQKDSAGTDKKAKFIKLLQTDVRDLSKPALLFIAPYVLSLVIAIVNPIATLFFLPISSSLSQYGHYRYNQIVREQEDQKTKILGSIGSLRDELQVVDQQIKATFIDSIDKYEGMEENEQKENKIKEAIVSNLAKFEDIILQMNRIENETVAKLTELDASDLSEDDIQECVKEIYKLQEKLDDTLSLLTDKMSYIYTDETTRQHVLNVVEITKKLIEEKTGALQISFEEEQYYKYIAVMNALLHDIGKNLTPEGILNTPRQLEENEFAIMKKHTQKGSAVLEDERIKEIYAPFVYGAKYHHIRYVKDGKEIKVTPRSYPVMTQEDQNVFNEALNSVSFNEQKLTFLIAVVDVYEALTAKRPYKEPMTMEESFEIMRKDNGLTQENVELLAQVYMPKQNAYVADTKVFDGIVFASPIEIIKNKIKTMRMNILAPVADKGTLLSDNAHIWEEIVFRAVPAIIALINPVVGIPLFLVMQPLFIFSHTIVQWLVQKDSSGEEKLSFKELAKNDFKNLALPTVAMSLPYIIAFALPMFAPFATVLSAKIFALFAATVTAQVSHYEYNKVQDSDKNLSIMPKISSLVIYNGSKLNDILNQNVVVTTKSGSMHILNFSPKTVSSAGRYLGGIQKGEYSSYGIENVEYDDEGNIVGVTFKEGTVVSTLKQDGQPLSSQENNIDFSQEQLTALYSDTDTNGYMDIYLDADSKDINRAIKEAAENNKLIVFHLFKEGFNTFEMSPSQIYENYQKAYSLISNQVHLSEIFPDLNKDKEHTDFSLDFFFQEMMKNAFVHGNLGNFEYPIAVNIKLNEKGTVETLTVYNGLTSQKISKEAEFLANSSLLFGDHMGSEIMRHNPVRTYSTKEESLNDIRFWKATTSVRDTIDENNVQWEYDYKHPKQKTHQEMLEDFWGLQTKSTVERLYDTGFNKYLKQYLKQTGKLEKDITQEEIMEIEEKAKHYRYTFPGLVNGVFLETFALFSKDFIAAHGNMSFGMKIVVWTIRALSVGLGITAAVCTFSVLPLSSVLLVAAISSVVGAGSVISSGFIIHLAWNTGAVLTGNKDSLLQTESNVTEESEITDVSEQSVRVRNRIPNKGQTFSIKNFFDRKKIEIRRKNGRLETFDFNADYEMPENYSENYRIKMANRYYCTWKPEFKDNGSWAQVEFFTKDGYEFVDFSDKSFRLEKDGSRKVVLKNTETGEEITVEVVIINGDVVGRVINYNRIIDGDRLGNRNISQERISLRKDSKYKMKDTISDIDEELKNKFGLKEVSYEAVDNKVEVTLIFNDGKKEIIELPDNDSVIYLEHDGYLFGFNRHYCVPIKIYKINDNIFTRDTSSDDILDFKFKDDISYIDKPRGYRLKDFTDRNFVIKKGNKEYMLYFDSKNNAIYDVSGSKKQKIKRGDLRDYGILRFEAKKGEITELLLDEDVSMQVDVRQPIGITESDIKNRMKDFSTGTIRNLDGLDIKEVIPILKRACPTLTEEDFKRLTRTGYLDEQMKEKIRATNYQGNITLSDIDFSDEQRSQEVLKNNPMIYSIFVEALFRTVEALSLNEKIKLENKENPTVDELIDAIANADIDKKFFESQLRGYFGEIYCTKTIVAGVFDGMILRLQMPDASNEPGIDLIDPVTGMKIQVKTGEEQIVNKHLEKNWKTDDFFSSGIFGPKMIPVLTVMSAKNGVYQTDDKVQSFGIEAKTVTGWIEYLLNYKSNGKTLDRYVMRDSLNSKLNIIDEFLSTRRTVWSLKDKFEIGRVAMQSLETVAAILPENMAVVNESLQKGERAIKVAAKIAIAEIKDSLLPDFVERHESQAGKAGASQIREFLEKYMPVAEKASKISARLGRIAEKIIIGASVVKHIAIDYKFIKSSGIQEAIKMFGTNARLSAEGTIEVGIVEDIEEASSVYELENTGIKINGSSIYRVKDSDLLLYGSKGNSAIKVAQVINGTTKIKEEIKKMFNKEGIEADEIETEGIVRTAEEGIGIKEGLLEIGEMDLEGKTAKQISAFITSSLEVKRAIGLMFAQKTIIGLESITDINKLKIAIENGRTRKVITEEQYKILNLSKAEIDSLREQGIEIYIDGNESKKEYMENGISGQIIREADGVKIRDYYMQEDVEIKEILTEQESVEQALVNQEKPVLVDIEILKKQFKSQRDITNIQRELGALLGKIKVNMKIGELTANDIENMGYNVSFNRVPQLKEKELEDLMRAETKDDVISLIGAESEFAIILKSIKTKELTQTFVELIKERILAKKSLLESKNELEGAELQEKKQEIMLGKMLYRQIKNKYSDTKEVDMDDVTGANATAKLMENIEKLKGLDSQNKSKDTREQEVLVNTIIEIILYDGKRVKGDVIKEQKSEDMSKTYRAMLAAA